MSCRRITVEEFRTLPRGSRGYDTENECENSSSIVCGECCNSFDGCFYCSEGILQQEPMCGGFIFLNPENGRLGKQIDVFNPETGQDEPFWVYSPQDICDTGRFGPNRAGAGICDNQCAGAPCACPEGASYCTDYTILPPACSCCRREIGTFVVPGTVLGDCGQLSASQGFPNVDGALDYTCDGAPPGTTTNVTCNVLAGLDEEGQTCPEGYSPGPPDSWAPYGTCRKESYYPAPGNDVARWCDECTVPEGYRGETSCSFSDRAVPFYYLTCRPCTCPGDATVAENDRCLPDANTIRTPCGTCSFQSFQSV